MIPYLSNRTEFIRFDESFDEWHTLCDWNWLTLKWIMVCVITYDSLNRKNVLKEDLRLGCKKEFAHYRHT